MEEHISWAEFEGWPEEQKQAWREKQHMSFQERFDPLGRLDMTPEERAAEKEAKEALVARLLAAYRAERAAVGYAEDTKPSLFEVESAIKDLNLDDLDTFSSRRADLKAQFLATYPALDTGAAEICGLETLHMYVTWHDLNWERIDLERRERDHAEEGERLREKRARLEAEGKVRPKPDTSPEG